MPDVGFGAEEVARVEPLLTTTNDKGEIEGVKYAQISTVLVNAVNEQQAEIERQQLQIDAQNKLILEQKRRLEALQKLVCAANADAEICREESK